MCLSPLFTSCVGAAQFGVLGLYKRKQYDGNASQKTGKLDLNMSTSSPQDYIPLSRV